MGDVVLGILLKKTPGAQMKLTSALLAASSIDAYVVVADEAQRPHALAAVQSLRAAGIRIDYSFGSQKVGKQFQTADALGARATLLFGDEWPAVKMKTLATRDEILVSQDELLSRVEQTLSS